MDFILQQKMESWCLDQNRQPLKLEVTDVEKLQEESESEDDDYDTDDTDSTEDDTDLPKVSVYTFQTPAVS